MEFLITAESANTYLSKTDALKPASVDTDLYYEVNNLMNECFRSLMPCTREKYIYTLFDLYSSCYTNNQ